MCEQKKKVKNIRHPTGKDEMKRVELAQQSYFEFIVTKRKNIHMSALVNFFQ